MFRVGEVINGRWLLVKKAGQGSFCTLFVAKDQQDDSTPLLGLKIARAEAAGSVLKWEAHVLREMSGSEAVPRFVHFGQHQGEEYLVMELLQGEDMSRLRNRVRETSGSGLVPLPVACHFVRNILRCVQALHQRGFIHRDVKPANFVRKSIDSTEFCMIDFGIAKQYLGKDGKIRKQRESAEFRGTTIYASPHVHNGIDHSPRDDLYSILFVFLDLVGGKLPWSEAARAKDKPTVASMKQEYLASPDKLIQWTLQCASEKEAANEGTCKEYDRNFPPLAQDQTRRLIQYLETIKYEDTPDYGLIDDCFVSCVSQPDFHNLADINYSGHGFSWKCSDAEPLDLSKEPLMRLIDLNDTVLAFEHEIIAKLLMARVKTPASEDTLPRPYSLDDGLKWHKLVNELLALNALSYDSKFASCLRALTHVMKSCEYFFLAELGPSSARWDDFLAVERAAFHLIDFSEREKLRSDKQRLSDSASKRSRLSI